MKYLYLLGSLFSWDIHILKKSTKQYIAQGQIDKLGGYILDEDLQQAINDTKRVMNAQSQIEVLHSQVEKIRKKYQ